MNNLVTIIAQAIASPLPRGSRIASTAIPANMLANMQRDEARAWSHSALAGALWEAGLRASRAISLAADEPHSFSPGQSVFIDIWTCGKKCPAEVVEIGRFTVSVICGKCGGRHCIATPQVSAKPK